MEARDTYFPQVIADGSKQFIVPVFQRDYRWEEAQWDRLWNDVYSCGTGKKEHFLGSLVSVAFENGSPTFSRWLIIDGQQRLTSISVLLAALRDHIQDTNWSGGEDSPTYEKINNQYLTNPYEGGERRYKLLLRHNDKLELQELVDQHSSRVFDDRDPGRIESAYVYFKSKLKHQESEIDVIWKGIHKLKIVDVTLSKDDNPQLVFESLNSTGVGLSQSDLIRNYILLGLTESEQARLYSEYWSQIESLLKKNEHDLSYFLRDYLALLRKDTKAIKDDQIYNEFKLFAPSLYSDKTLEALLNDLVRFAGYYAQFKGYSKASSDKLTDALRAVRLHSSTPAILVMRLFDFHEKNTLTEAEFVQSLRFLESYLCRRAVTGLPSNSYWMVFARISHQMMNDSPYKSFLFYISTLNHNYVFPSDETFVNKLQTSELYHRLSLCKNILDRLENFGQEEPSPISKYTVEHIMPQTLNKKWRTMLGVNAEKTHEEWLHRLGNLTLTAYNARYSNSTFNDKKNIAGGFNESSVRLNKFVRDQNEWTSVQMVDRGRILADKALEIWGFPVIDEESIKKIETWLLRCRELEKSVRDLNLPSVLEDTLLALDHEIRDMDDGIIGPIEGNSVCYYNPNFFVEVLPTNDRLRLLLNVGVEEFVDLHGTALDITDWSYIRNATNDHPYRSEVGLVAKNEIDLILPFVRMAYNKVDDWR